MTDRMKTYTVEVRDPEDHGIGGRKTYHPIRAVSEEHADRQARARFAGPLEPPNDRLIVNVSEVPAS